MEIKRLYLLTCYIMLSVFNCAYAQLVTTIAGQVEIPGSNDGQALLGATFNNPHGLAVDNQGNVYTTDRWSHTIRKITPNGDVTTFAGQSGISGSADGIGNVATFNEPWGICVGSNGTVYVADTRNNKIRKISPTGQVTTLAGSGNFGTSDGLATSATFGNPTGIETDNNGNVYVADHLTHIIRKIDENGWVSTIAGKPYIVGDDDGQGSNASFRRPYGLTLDLDGNILVADEWNHKIRRIDLQGNVTTVAGDGLEGGDDGSVVNASFNFPWDMTVDSIGNIYVADGYNYVIRKIGIDGIVSSYAGRLGTSGGLDGIGEEASFSGATAIALSPFSEELYVGDAYNHLVRKITDLNQGISLFAVGGNTSLCEGENLEINAQPEIFLNYTFYVDGNLAQNSSSNNFSTQALQPGIHTILIEASDDVGNINTDEITIEVFSAIQPTISVVGETTFFEGDSVTLISSFGNNYFWSNGMIDPTITVFESGNYTVEVTDDNGCVGISEPIIVEVLGAPGTIQIVANGSEAICEGTSTILQSSIIDGNQWMKDGWPIEGENAQLIEVTEAGLYQAQTTDQDGFVIISDPIEITVLEGPVALFEATPRMVLIGDPVQFNVLTPEVTVNWNFGDPDTGLMNESSELSPSHIYSDKGIYTVSLEVTDASGCKDLTISESYVQVVANVALIGEDLYIPSAFTPNGDGENDILFVRGSNISDVEFKVFNQWGEVVFESFNQSIGWDGSCSNISSQIGNYVYLLKYQDSAGEDQTVSGHVTLLR